MIELSPVQRVCPACSFGWVEPFVLCKICDGLGRTWVDGGPTFGCQWLIADRRPGEILTLGNGDRGRLIRHDNRKNPTWSWLKLIGEFDGLESHDRTGYPACTGVASVSNPSWFYDVNSHNGEGDAGDPLQRRKAL